MTSTTQQAPVAVPAPAAAVAAPRPARTPTGPPRTRIPAGSILLVLIPAFITLSMFASQPLEAQFGSTGGWVAYAAIVAAIVVAIALIIRSKARGTGGRGLFGSGGRGSGSGLGPGGGRTGLGRLFGGLGRGRSGRSPTGSGAAGGKRPGLLDRIRSKLPKGFPGSTKGRQPKGTGPGGLAGKGSPSGRGSGRGAGSKKSPAGSGSGSGGGKGSGPKSALGKAADWVSKAADWVGKPDKKKAAKKKAAEAAAAKKAQDELDKAAKKAGSGRTAEAGKNPQAEQGEKRKPSPHPPRDDGPTRNGEPAMAGNTAGSGAAGDGFGREGDGYSFIAWLLRSVPGAARSVQPRAAQFAGIQKAARNVYQLPRGILDPLDQMGRKWTQLQAIAEQLPAMARTMHPDDIASYETPAGGSHATQATRDVQPYKEGGGT